MVAKWMGLGIGSAVGIACAAWNGTGWLLGGWTLLLAARTGWRRKARRPWGKIDHALWMAGLGMLLGLWRFEHITGDPGHVHIQNVAAQNRTVSIRGRISAEPDVKSAKAVALDIMAEEVRGDSGPWQTIPPTRCRVVLLAGRGTNLPPVQTKIPHACRPRAYGYSVRVEGLRPQKGDTPPSRRRAEPVVLLGHWTGFRLESKTEGHPVMEAALDLKERLLAGFAARLSDRSARLAAGMTLGDKAAVYGADYHGWDSACPPRSSSCAIPRNCSAPASSSRIWPC